MLGLVGREAEVSRLRAFLAGLADGPSALVIEGEPGIGKTALWEAAVSVAAGTLVLRTRCAEAESGLAYGGLTDLLGPVAEMVMPALPSPQRRALEVVLGRAEPGEDVVEPQVVGRTTLAVLESLPDASPVLAAIDDVQWLDPPSTRALTFALRRLPAVPLGVLLTRRGRDGPLPLGLDDALPRGRRERLLVGPLDRDDLELLVETRLGDPLPRAVRRRMAAASGGNPLYALELVEALRRSGQASGDLAALPARLEELLADRLGRLPPEATAPFAAVAGLRRPLGAARGHVAAQFLIESMLLAALGGATGVAVGTLATYALALQRGWQPLVPAAAIWAGLGAALLIGAIAGLYPAQRAARRSPTDAVCSV
jgi:hypothetical protein